MDGNTQNRLSDEQDGGGRHLRFTVPFDYPVRFTRGVFGKENDLLACTLDRLDEGRRHRAAVYIDSGVAVSHPNLITRLKSYFHRCSDRMELAASPEIIPGGEGIKNGWKAVRNVMFGIGNLHLDRQSFVIAVGGGSMLDMLGFAASIVHRGLRMVRIPTTTLSQCDGGLGVKNGMNEHGQKNFVGTFSPPFAVLNDFDFLTTLDRADWIGGVAEAFKVALIKDAEFFCYLCDNADMLAARNVDVMERVIRRCAGLHLEHIEKSGDPFEYGSARPLDFGHWAGHRLEVQTHYRFSHGQCVAVGIAIDSYYAMRKGFISREEMDRLLDAMVRCGLPIYMDELSELDRDGTPVVLEGIEQFREHLGGNLNVTVPEGIGNKIEIHNIDSGIVKDGIDFLRKMSHGNGS